MIKIFIKETWRLFPFVFIIGFISRLIISSTVISYLESIGDVSMMIKFILTCWVLIPMYYSLRNSYYDLMGCQTYATILWNNLARSIRKLDKASKERIKQTKLRIWVEKNPEINILNYWFLKVIRKKEWMNIDIEKEER